MAYVEADHDESACGEAEEDVEARGDVVQDEADPDESV